MIIIGFGITFYFYYQPINQPLKFYIMRGIMRGNMRGNMRGGYYYFLGII